ncbi:MAG: hypothetical protein IJJ43_07995 [Oscillospiraceae bacterium]|nr:hypothetical protein [Oscillospiraceae bacterium]
MEIVTAAAGGRSRRAQFTAAVEKPEGEHKPERFFGHRKAGIVTAAAGGRNRRSQFTAAVEKPEGERKPERFFGNRKAEAVMVSAKTQNIPRSLPHERGRLQGKDDQK